MVYLSDIVDYCFDSTYLLAIAKEVRMTRLLSEGPLYKRLEEIGEEAKKVFDTTKGNILEYQIALTREEMSLELRDLMIKIDRETLKQERLTEAREVSP